jgi:hypothetical protein
MLETVSAAESKPALGRAESSARSDNGTVVRQAIVVDVVHESVSHTERSSRREGVWSSAPKYSPVTVTEAPPVSGILDFAAFVATGASNENSMYPVPPPRYMSTDACSCSRYIFGARDVRQAKLVGELHELVWQPTVPTDSVGDGLLLPKFRPDTVPKLPLVRGMLVLAELTTGPSKEKRLKAVPVFDPTVTRTSAPALFCSKPKGESPQATAVMDVHDIVRQC